MTMPLNNMLNHTTISDIPPEYQVAERIDLIALTGFAGAGKDTAADALATHTGFIKLAFADPLRNEIAQAYQLRSHESELLTNRATKELPTARLALTECDSFGFIGAVARATSATVDAAWLQAPRSPRQIMEWWGTEYRRAQQPTYWTNKMALRVKDLVRMGHRRLVITDCRFENEAACVRRMGGFIWQIIRPEADLAAAQRQHRSVNDGREFLPTQKIHNNLDILDLRNAVLGAWWSTEAKVHIEVLGIAREASHG